MELTFKDNVVRITSEWQETPRLVPVNILSASWKKFAEQFTRIAPEELIHGKICLREKKNRLEYLAFLILLITLLIKFILLQES